MNKKRLLFTGFLFLVFGLFPKMMWAETRTISVNFSGGGNDFPVSTGKYSSELIGYEGYAVPGNQWIDCTAFGGTGGTPTTLVPLELKDNTQEVYRYKNVKVYLCSRGGCYNHNSNNSGNTQMLHEYLDDSGSYNRAGFKLADLPFSQYTVLIYFNRDGGGPIPPYQINGTYYAGTSQGTVEATEKQTWGNPCDATTLSEELNTLIVKNLTEKDLIVQAPQQCQDCRGCISGFQVVGTLPDDEGETYSADLTGNATWSTKEGIENESGTWIDNPSSIISLSNQSPTPLTLKFDQSIWAKTLSLSGSGETTITVGQNASLDIDISFLDFSQAGKTILGFNPRYSNIIAGEDTVLEQKGLGKLTVGAEKKATIILSEDSNNIWGGLLSNTEGTICKIGTGTLSIGSELADFGAFEVGEGDVHFSRGWDFCNENALTLNEGTLFSTTSNYKYDFTQKGALSGAGTFRIKIPQIDSQKDGWRPAHITGNTENFTGTLELEGTYAEQANEAYKIRVTLNPQGNHFGAICFVGVNYDGYYSKDNPEVVPNWTTAILGKDLTITGLNGLGGIVECSVPATLTLASDGENVFGGTIKDGETSPLTLKKMGTGSMILSGANSYSGGTTFQGGTLTINHPEALGTGTVALDGCTVNIGINRLTNLVASATGGTKLNFVMTQEELASTSDICLLETTFPSLDGITVSVVDQNGQAVPQNKIVFTPGTQKLLYRPDPSTPLPQDLLCATVAGNSTWEDLEWTYADGTQYNGDWSETIPAVRLNAAGGTITGLPKNVTVKNIRVFGAGALTIAPTVENSSFIAPLIDFTGQTGCGTLGANFTPQSVIAGKDTVLSVEGTGTLTVNREMRATVDGFIWTNTVHEGVIAVRGGTETKPLTIHAGGANTVVGPYYICENSVLKCESTDQNKLYLIDGAGAGTSTMILDSDKDWGMTSGTRIRNVKLLIDCDVQFYYERTDALDRSVFIDLNCSEFALSAGNPVLGGLSGKALIWGGNGEPLSVYMENGPATYSGQSDRPLVVGGTDALTLSYNHAKSKVTILEGAKVIYPTESGATLEINSPISGAGTLVKQGVGALVLTGDSSGFTGPFIVEGGSLEVSGTIGNAPAFIAADTTILLKNLNCTAPLFRLETKTGDAATKIPLYIEMTEANLLSAQYHKLIQLKQGMTKDVFEIHVVSNLADPVDIDSGSYVVDCDDQNVLQIKSTVKIWSGTADGNGEWSTSPSVLSWNNGQQPFNEHDKVTFGEIANADPVVTVVGQVQAKGVGLKTTSSKYTFTAGNDALILLDGALVFDQGESVVNVPIKTSSEIDINDGMNATLGLFGSEVETTSKTATYTGTLNLRPNGTLTVAPGLGKTQIINKLSSITDQSHLVISNGIMAVEGNGGNGTSGFFKDISPVVQKDGVLLFRNNTDVSGYDTTKHPIVVYPGGELRVEKRDTLRRGLTLNGGKVTVAGEDGGRGLDFYGNDTEIQVDADSEIIGLPTETNTIGEPLPDEKIALRGDPIIFNVAEGVTLRNDITYCSVDYGATLKKMGPGIMVQNGKKKTDTERYPLIYKRNTVVQEGTYELNCEHENESNTYLVKTGARLTGTGSITGAGKVEIEGPNSKLCGRLRICNLELGNGVTIGDQWNSVSAKVFGELSVRTNETQAVTIQNGTFTIGKGCTTTNASKFAFTLAKPENGSGGMLALEAGASLSLDTPPVVQGDQQCGFQIGVDYSGDKPLYSTLQVTGEMDVSDVKFVVNVEAGEVRTSKIPLIKATSIIGDTDLLSVDGLPEGRKWKYVVESDTEGGTQTLYAVTKQEFILILK